MHKIQCLLKKKGLRQFLYVALTAFLIFVLWLVGQLFNINQFLERSELWSLDLRYKIPHQTVKINSNVVILSIDDTSLEVLEDTLGRWPWSRDTYTQVINYLESGGVNSIAFDLMFIGYQKGFEDKDIALAKAIAKNDNVYVSMNFDTRETKAPPKLPDVLKVNLENNSKINLSWLTYSNCRLILNEILSSSPNIGIINFARDDDGISRRAPLFFRYNDGYYPYLAFKLAYNYLKKKENLNIDKFVINKDKQLVIGNKNIHLDDDGLMLINWYGPDHTFQYVPLWQVMKSIHDIKSGKKPILPPGFFKDKVVFVGVTATSLYDIKGTPLSSIFPGVEAQATVFNNIIDGNSIKKASNTVNILISVFLCIITGLLVLKLKSSFLSSFLTLLMAALYIVYASFMLIHNFVWIGIASQIIVIMLTFTFMYIIKYLMKSRDFEYTYKLATTDGLTGLHNHRFFQEHLVNSIERSKRYKNNFSLLLIDIDFFKKFNDTYGHQAGDAVLRQVADTLKKTVRSLDLVARYGGEEMAIVLENVDIEEAIVIANKVCSTVAERMFRLSETVEKNVTISIGVATYPLHGETPATLIEFADQGLYRAKESGRNQIGKIEGYETGISTGDLTPDQA